MQIEYHLPNIAKRVIVLLLVSSILRGEGVPKEDIFCQQVLAERTISTDGSLKAEIAADVYQDASQLWQAAMRQAIDRGDRRPYLEIEPKSVRSAVEGPRIGRRQRGSLAMDATDLLRILPPLPKKAGVMITTNKEDEIELHSRYFSLMDIVRSEGYLGMKLTRHGDGTDDLPFEVHIDDGNIGSEAIRRHLEQKGAPRSELYESPSFLFFSRLTEWLKDLAWGGPAWFVVTHVIDGHESLFNRLRWEIHPNYFRGRRIRISHPLSAAAATAA
jgi:hypothetical protein